MSIISASTTSTTAYKVTADTTGTLVLQTGASPTTAVTIGTDQNVTMAGRTTNPTTISVGGATPSTSGAGITFPATQSASTDANTLDDYEEGTWTPSFGGNTVAGSATYTVQNGKYTKIGQLVIANFDVISSSALTGATGVLAIRGLPFAAVSTNLSAGAGSIGYYSGISGTNNTYTLYIDPTATWCIPTFGAGSTVISYGATANIANGSRMQGTIIYTAAT